ncbi:hypothetical protein [uncultured Adlercreutzia sp.]|uniref:hypothetical protein n=1 Tax=uncultured Adlercreutzia sp. TaxID=875803 RepID=UPI0026F3D0BA|nr:hypothetical protein [uncultured Adlercreutzia sp.]
MSGPKTSQLEIERRIQAQLAALRSDVDHGRARARRRIAARRDELLAAAAGCEGCGDIAEDIREAAARALARLDAECVFTPCPRMEDSVESAARCTTSAAAIADAFDAEAAGLAERIERARMRQEAHADARDFTAMLQAAVDQTAGISADAGDAERGSQGESALESGGTADTASATAENVETVGGTRAVGFAESDRESSSGAAADDAQAIAARALALVNDPYALPADRALLLDAARDFGAATAPQIALLLPAMESNAAAMADLAALIDDAAAQLASRGLAAPAAPPAFATLEEAAHHLEALRAALDQADRDAYLQVCIDTVMARHGYDIARSVRMGRDLAGTHRLYGSAAGTEGIHAFVSDQGDLMLQVAGTPRGLANVEDGDEVSLEAAPAGLRSEALLESQSDFCAVYDEIADDLAEFGIVNSVRYKAAPDAAFCREVVKAEAAEGASATATAQRRRRKAGAATRELS